MDFKKGKLEKNEKKDVRLRNKDILKRFKETSIKDFVIRLKQEQEDISTEDTIEILTEFGLGAIPFSQVFKKQVLEKLDNRPENITFNNIKLALKSITEKEIENDQVREQLKLSHRSIDEGKIKDPFLSTISLIKHPYTARFLKTPSHGKIARKLGINEELVDKLLANFPSELRFSKIDVVEASKTIGIKKEMLQVMKFVLCLEQGFLTQIDFAIALSKEKSSIKDLVYSTLFEFRKIAESSKTEITDNEINEILTKAKKKYPEIAYFTQVFSQLKLPSDAQDYLRSENIEDFNGLRKIFTTKDPKAAKIYADFEEKIGDIKKMDSLKDYGRLERLSKNYNLNTELIKQGFNSSRQIARIPLTEFLDKFKNKTSSEELKTVYCRAQEEVPKMVSLVAMSTLTAKNHRLDKLLFKKKGVNFYEPV